MQLSRTNNDSERTVPSAFRNTIIALLMSLGGLQGCGLTGIDVRPTIPGALQSEMRKTRVLIEQEIGDASAQRPEQCRVIPIGAKACGGPQAYLVYSIVESNERKVQELARQYTEAEQKYNRVTDAMSTCSYVMPPEVYVENGKCVSTHGQNWRR